MELIGNKIRMLPTVGWHTLEDAYCRIANPCHTTPQRKYLQARDVAALDAYREMLSSAM